MARRGTWVATGWVAVVCIALAVMASTAFYTQFSLNHDASWYLVATRQWLDGAVLYRDIMEINPPLAFYLTVPALDLADALGVSATQGFFLYVTLLAGLSGLWVYRLARQAGLSALSVGAMTGAALIANLLIPMHDFGQREHLMVLFALPYLHYLFWQGRLTALSRGEQALLGISAFCGLGLKPYFLLIPAGAVLVRLVYTRDARALFALPNVTLGMMLVAYVAFIAIVHPLYLSAIVPTAQLVYSAFGTQWGELLIRREMLALGALFALALMGARSLDAPAWSMLGGVAGALAAYIVQDKGWTYQLIPMMALLLIGTMWILRSEGSPLRQRVGRRIAAFAILVGCLCVQVANGPYVSRSTIPFARHVDRPGMGVLVLSTNVSAAFPFVNEVAARWTSRYPAQWLLPGAITKLAATDCLQAAELCVRYQGVLDAARTAMVDDLARERPDLVYVDGRIDKSYFTPHAFDYLTFMGQDPRMADIWREYRPIGKEGPYRVWAHRSVDQARLGRGKVITASSPAG